MTKTPIILPIIILILALVSVFFSPVSLTDFTHSVHAHPALVLLATEHPNQQIAVIVQKAGKGDAATRLVKKLGGRVLTDLSMINSFSAELEARAALELARSSTVRWVSLDAPVERSERTTPPPGTRNNTYLQTLRVHPVWNMGINGAGIGVAVIDSGVTNSQDLTLRKSSTFNPNSTSVQDYYGHGTHVAGIIAGTGTLSDGMFQGVAPGANLISLKVCDETGMAYESDVVAAMQWVLQNKESYNIRVVNISLNSTVEQSYHTSPLDAAVEVLWFRGIVVVASSGNTTETTPSLLINAAPANDPFIITVGATDEKATGDYSDDVVAAYTSQGVSSDGFIKPEIFAPGSNVVSVLSSKSNWDETYPERVVASTYFRLSGTSMAAPMVTGAVALLLQDEPNLTPDQVKYRLTHATSRFFNQAFGTTSYTIPYLDIYAAVSGTTTESSNTGITASQLLWSGAEQVSWNSIAWNSVAWNSVAWNSVAWNSAYWGP